MEPEAEKSEDKSTKQIKRKTKAVVKKKAGQKPVPEVKEEPAVAAATPVEEAKYVPINHPVKVDPAAAVAAVTVTAALGPNKEPDAILSEKAKAIPNLAIGAKLVDDKLIPPNMVPPSLFSSKAPPTMPPLSYGPRGYSSLQTNPLGMYGSLLFGTGNQLSYMLYNSLNKAATDPYASPHFHRPEPVRPIFRHCAAHVGIAHFIYTSMKKVTSCFKLRTENVGFGGSSG